MSQVLDGAAQILRDGSRQGDHDPAASPARHAGSRCRRAGQPGEDGHAGRQPGGQTDAPGRHGRSPQRPAGQGVPESTAWRSSSRTGPMTPARTSGSRRSSAARIPPGEKNEKASRNRRMPPRSHRRGLSEQGIVESASLRDGRTNREEIHHGRHEHNPIGCRRGDDDSHDGQHQKCHRQGRVPEDAHRPAQAPGPDEPHGRHGLHRRSWPSSPAWSSSRTSIPS